MRFLLIHVPLLLFISGCKEESNPEFEDPSKEISTVDLFNRTLMTQDKVVFYSDKPGPSEYGSCKLELHKDSRASLSTAGISFGLYNGVYNLKNNSLEFSFPSSERVLMPGYTKFPTLILKETNGILILTRKDGLKNLEEEGNIYPDPHDQAPPVFPLKTRTK